MSYFLSIFLGILKEIGDSMDTENKEIKVLTNAKDIQDRIRELYSTNAFMMDYFHIHIDEIHCGSARVSMVLDENIHNNHRHRIHGGVFAALADSVTGVTAATVGAAVVTVNMNLNFIRTAKSGEKITMDGRIIHLGHTTIVEEGEMRDEKGRIMCKMTATMMPLDWFPEIPRKWEE